MIRTQRQPAAPERQLASATVSVTCLTDGRAHDVPDSELAVGASQRSGYYYAVCGHLVAAAPMVEPDGDHCMLCAEMWDLNHGRKRRARAH